MQFFKFTNITRIKSDLNTVSDCPRSPLNAVHKQFLRSLHTQLCIISAFCTKPVLSSFLSVIGSFRITSGVAPAVKVFLRPDQDNPQQEFPQLFSFRTIRSRSFRDYFPLGQYAIGVFSTLSVLNTCKSNFFTISIQNITQEAFFYYFGVGSTIFRRNNNSYTFRIFQLTIAPSPQLLKAMLRPDQLLTAPIPKQIFRLRFVLSTYAFSSVADPDPVFFGSPGSGSGKNRSTNRPL